MAIEPAVQDVIVASAQVASLLERARQVPFVKEHGIKFKKCKSPQKGQSWVRIEALSDFECGLGAGILLALVFCVDG